MTAEPSPPEDMTRTLTYTAIAGLAFILASALGNIVIVICQCVGLALLAFVAAAIASRYWQEDNRDWPHWVKIVSGHLRGIAARFAPRWFA